MFKMKRLVLSAALLTAFLLQACIRMRLDVPPSIPTAREIEPLMTEERPAVVAGLTAIIELSTPTVADGSPTLVFLPRVTISAVKGNLFIRRGPDMAFNPVDVLYEGTSAKAIARDVLADWVQIEIPNSNKTGWVSVQTKYSQVSGDLNALPGITTTEWPVAAYLRNCTHHRMLIMPGEITLPSYFGSPENEIWLYPGTYTVLDYELPDLPEVMEVEIREGLTVDIMDDGLGEHRKCP